MGKIKRLLDRFDEMGRYPIQELGYSRTWLMFSYLGAFLVHRCTIADYFLYHFYERNRRGRAEFVTLYDMRDIHRKNPQTAFADFEEKDRFLDRFQAYVHRDWIGRVCRNSREEFDAFADRHPRCIIKPRTDSGGHGVELCTITPNNRDQVWERLTSQDMIAEELLEQCPEAQYASPVSRSQLVARTNEELRRHLCDSVSIEDICQRLNLSKSYLSSLYKRKTGKSIIAHFNEMKIEEARRLIASGLYNFTEIAERLGISVNTVKVLYHQAVTQLRKLMKSGYAILLVLLVSR